MTRYKILDELLSNRYHNYSLDDLTEEVNHRLADLCPDTDGVGRRTIEKDIAYLEYEGPFLVEIERYSVAGYNPERQKTYTKRCLRYADPSFSIFKKKLSSDEEYLLKGIMSLLGQFDGLPNLDALEQLRLGLSVKEDYRQIVSFTRNPLENTNIFGRLFTAISQRQAINLHYHTFKEPHKSRKITVHPHLLKEYNRRWYLFATTETDGKLLQFALDRVDTMEPLPAYKYKEYDGDIHERFKDIVGVTLLDESELHRIYFWVSDASKDYVLTKPIHDSQCVLSADDDAAFRVQYPSLTNGLFFRIDCRSNYELIRELSSFGKELIVLEPSKIQKAVWERICSAKEEYQKLRK